MQGEGKVKDWGFDCLFFGVLMGEFGMAFEADLLEDGIGFWRWNWENDTEMGLKERRGDLWMAFLNIFKVLIFCELLEFILDVEKGFILEFYL